MKTIPVKATVTFAEFEKIDIRVGTIEKLEDIKESDKLVELTVNFGDFYRKIIVGLKQERQNPQEIVGLQALFVVNLAPKTIMGRTSEGMIFDIGYSNEITPVLSVPEKPVANGVSAG